MANKKQPKLSSLETSELPQADDTTVLESKQDSFPIVGIGASAGGLEAIEQFFRNTPANCGVAFIIIQHLDPNHIGIMPELIQRVTTMKVCQAKDHQKIQANCVYIIPPNKDMSILQKTLHLFDMLTPRGLRLPIDFFFRSLADDQNENSIGIILSGMGTDGTMGLRKIKEKAGVVLVQEPNSAKFDGMPRSAIDAGLADFIAPAEELPAKLFSYLQHTTVVRKGVPLESKALSALEKIIILLRTYTGQDFSLYKKNTIYRRIERRMSIHQIDKIAMYVRFLQENPAEITLLFKELLIGVTSFFRDPESWETLKEQTIPTLLKKYPEGGVLRAWVVGCSTGEEAYSLAIVFKEALEKVANSNFSVQIFATDIDTDAIDLARQGNFPSNITADVSTERLTRFFVMEENGTYRVSKFIREMIIFAPQNFIMDPPFTKLDILTCRNLLIYLEPELQKKIIPLIHYCLNPGGALFLGNAETVGTSSQYFSVYDHKARIFLRNNNISQPEAIDYPITFFPTNKKTTLEVNPQKPAINLQSLVEQYILRRFSPPAVVVNDKGDIVYISGRTGKYIEPPTGKVNWNIFAMAREGLRFELVTAFQQAQISKEVVIRPNIIIGTNGDHQTVDLSIELINEPEDIRGLLVIAFSDVPSVHGEDDALPKKGTPSTRSTYIKKIEQELQFKAHELQTTREEMQTSQEELKSTNEELQSTNEELQSTNEELTTSKEEMQSMNEELQTINAELQSKVDDLSRTNNDMKNLLNSTNIATVFLDNLLNIRRFTIQATKLIKLIPSDVGRPIGDIVSMLIYPEMLDDVQDVLRTLIFSEKQIANRDGKWFSVRIMPYRTLENMIDGVVITFTDISAAKKLENDLIESNTRMEFLVHSIPNIIICFSTGEKITEFNPEAERILGYTRGEVIGSNFIERLIPNSARNQVMAELKGITDGKVRYGVTFPVLTKEGQELSFQWALNSLHDEQGNVSGVVSVGNPSST